MPYFRAKAGRAAAGWQVTKSNANKQKIWNRAAGNPLPWLLTSEEHHQCILPPLNVRQKTSSRQLELFQTNAKGEKVRQLPRRRVLSRLSKGKRPNVGALANPRKSH